jgi:hypothetical protein
MSDFADMGKTTRQDFPRMPLGKREDATFQAVCPPPKSIIPLARSPENLFLSLLMRRPQATVPAGKPDTETSALRNMPFSTTLHQTKRHFNHPRQQTGDILP